MGAACSVINSRVCLRPDTLGLWLDGLRTILRRVFRSSLRQTWRTRHAESTRCPYLQTYTVISAPSHAVFRLHHRTLYSSQPAYLRSSLHACHSTRSFRLSNTNLLSAPSVRTSSGARSFSVAAPKIWNSPSISPYLYQSWYLPSSPQDPLLPAGLPIHLTSFLLRFRFGCWPLSAFINYIYLLTY